MKLSTILLEKCIELPSKDQHELHVLLDEAGLEVKDIESHPTHTVYTIETLANRGDHLYALGVARELSGRLLCQINHPKVSDLTDRKASVPVKVETERCMRYALLEMTLPRGMSLRDDIARVVGADSKHHPIVDILNYAWLELGQPMHAFDREKVDGEVIISLTTKAEEIEALDGKTYKVPAESIVIRDRKRIIAVAGIIGCANTMVTPETTRVVIESASFDPVTVRKTARAMGISTDASYTFERGCDIEAVLTALKRVVFLLEGTGSTATAGQVVGLSYIEGPHVEKRKITLPIALVRDQMNLPRLNEAEISARLKCLGYHVEAPQGAKEYLVTVPSWRLWDVVNSEDLVEDFVRSHGLSGVKLELPPLDYEAPDKNDLERLYSHIEPALIGDGFSEVITRTFYSQSDLELLASLDPSIKKNHISLKNSIESTYAHLKATNILHLSDLAASNIRMGVSSVKIFELGRIFSRDKSGKSYEFERDMLTIAASGRWYEHDWRKPESIEETFALFRGTIEAIFASLGRTAHMTESKHPFLHPGFQAGVISGRDTYGFVGLVHPAIAAKRDIKTPIFYGELEAELLYRQTEESGLSLPSDFPAIRRDLTLKIKPSFFAGKVCSYVASLKLPNLTECEITDEFKKSEEDFRRVTYRLVFQSMDRTLEHGEVDAAIQTVLDFLKEKHSLELA